MWPKDKRILLRFAIFPRYEKAIGHRLLIAIFVESGHKPRESV